MKLLIGLIILLLALLLLRRFLPRQGPPASGRRWGVIAIVSQLLWLVPLALWFGLMVPFFVAEYRVVNQSGETLYLTPVNNSTTRQMLYVPERFSIGQIRAFRQTDIRLAAGESIRIAYDAEDARPYAIAVRNEAGEYRQVALNRGGKMWHSNEPEIVYIIGPFQTLSSISQEALRAIEQSSPFNVKFWGIVLGITAFFGGIPTLLLWVWLRRWVQSRRREGRSEDRAA